MGKFKIKWMSKPKENSIPEWEEIRSFPSARWPYYFVVLPLFIALTFIAVFFFVAFLILLLVAVCLVAVVVCGRKQPHASS